MLSGYVTLKIYDVLGRELATLVSEKQNAGSYIDQIRRKQAVERGLFLSLGCSRVFQDDENDPYEMTAINFGLVFILKLDRDIETNRDDFGRQICFRILYRRRILRRIDSSIVFSHC